MSSTHLQLCVLMRHNCSVTQCYQWRHKWDDLCHSSGFPWWAYFDLGAPKCVATIEIYNRIHQRQQYDRIVGAVLSLRTTSSGAPLWSVPVTSGTQNGGYTLTFKVGPTDSISGISTALVAGATRTATGVVLDGVDGYADLNFGSALLGGAMTIEIVAKVNTLTAYARLFVYGAPSGTAVNANNNADYIVVGAHLVSQAAPGQLGWSIRQGSASEKSASFPNSLVPGVRYHIVATVSGTTMRTYINGLKRGENLNGWEPNSVLRAFGYIGKGLFSGSSPLSGEVSSLKIYSGAMTETEVAVAYVASLPPCAKGGIASVCAVRSTNPACADSATSCCAGNATAMFLGASVTAIAANAFEGCASLTTVNLATATSLTSIGASAFSGCTSLTTLSFVGAAGVTSIGANAFTNTQVNPFTVNFGTLSCATVAAPTSFGFNCTGGSTILAFHWDFTGTSTLRHRAVPLHRRQRGGGPFESARSGRERHRRHGLHHCRVGR